MSNREKINEIEAARSKELTRVDDYYRSLLSPLYHQFTIEEIEAAGWVRGAIYYAMSNTNVGDWVYYYKKNNATIIVHTNPIQVRSMGPMNEIICDMDELNEIAK